MIDKLIVRTIMFLCRIRYRKVENDIFYIRGTKDKYPRYLLYTEDPNVYKRMDRF